MKSRVTGMSRSGSSETVKEALQRAVRLQAKPRFQNTFCSKRALATWHQSRSTPDANVFIGTFLAPDLLDRRCGSALVVPSSDENHDDNAKHQCAEWVDHRQIVMSACDVHHNSD
jgi:hypothetical protein